MNGENSGKSPRVPSKTAKGRGATGTSEHGVPGKSRSGSSGKPNLIVRYGQSPNSSPGAAAQKAHSGAKGMSGRARHNAGGSGTPPPPVRMPSKNDGTTPRD
jgi:hypothetical protein